LLAEILYRNPAKANHSLTPRYLHSTARDACG
jgi:hypothetical protein